MIIKQTEDCQVSIRPLEWDSETLGFKCGLVEITGVPDKAMLSALLVDAYAEAKDHGFSFLTSKVPADNINYVNALIKNKAKLIDTEVTYGQGNPEIIDASADLQGIVIEKSTNYWHDALYDLSGTINESRFFIDKRIGYDNARNLWNKSIYNSCNGRATYNIVAIEDGQPIGMMNVFEKEGISDIFLVAVNPSSQGNGVGGQMMQFYLSNLDADISHLTVETQLINNRAQAFYTKFGYKIIRAKHVLHTWI